MPKPPTALACLALLALAGCGAVPVPPKPLAVTERGPEPSRRAESGGPGPADHRIAIVCSGAVGGLFSHYVGGTSATPPTDREARAAVRARIADSHRSLQRQRLRLSVAPHPHINAFVVGTAAAAQGSSTFTVARGENGGIQVRSEEICYPARKGLVGPTGTLRRLPRQVPDYAGACAGEIRPHPAQNVPAVGATPVRAVRQRAAVPNHPLHGRRVYVPPVPKPYGQRTVVVAASPHGRAVPVPGRARRDRRVDRHPGGHLPSGGLGSLDPSRTSGEACVVAASPRCHLAPV